MASARFVLEKPAAGAVPRTRNVAHGDSLFPVAKPEANTSPKREGGNFAVSALTLRVGMVSIVNNYVALERGHGTVGIFDRIEDDSRYVIPNLSVFPASEPASGTPP